MPNNSTDEELRKQFIALLNDYFDVNLADNNRLILQLLSAVEMHDRHRYEELMAAIDDGKRSHSMKVIAAAINRIFNVSEEER